MATAGTILSTRLRPGSGSGAFLGREDNQIGAFDFAGRQPITGDPRLDADIWGGILRSRPNAFPQSYGAANGGANSILAAGNRAREIARMVRGGGGIPLTVPSGAPFGAFQGSTWNNAGGNPTNPFTTLQNTKNPSLQSAIDSILNGIRGLSADPNVNQNVVRANTKSQALASQISGAQNRFEADVNDSRQSFADFINAFRSSQPQAETNLRSDTGAIDQFYDTGPGGVRGELDRMARDRAMATTQAAQRAMQAATARNNFNRLLGGNSSYLDRQLADSVGGIATQAAREKADLDRTNFLTVKDAQARLSGQRNNLLDAYLNRFLTPAFARQQLAGNELSQLGMLTNLDQANTFYQLDSPEQMIARQLGLLGGVANLDQANNFYGLQRPYQPDASGMLRVGQPNIGAPDFYFPDLGSFDLGEPSQPSVSGRTPARSPNADALARYQAVSGVDPRSDPNFSAELMNWVTGHNNTPAAMRYAREAGINPYVDPNFSDDLWNWSMQAAA